MPKLRDRTPTPDDRFREAIASRAALLGLGYEDLIRRSGMRMTTFYARRKEPGRLTVRELRGLVRGLGLTDRQICAIVGVAYNGTTDN